MEAAGGQAHPALYSIFNFTICATPTPPRCWAAASIPRLPANGPSSIAITLDLYSHVLPNMQADAIEAMDNELLAAISKRAKEM